MKAAILALLLLSLALATPPPMPPFFGEVNEIRGNPGECYINYAAQGFNKGANFPAEVLEKNFRLEEGVIVFCAADVAAAPCSGMHFDSALFDASPRTVSVKAQLSAHVGACNQDGKIYLGAIDAEPATPARTIPEAHGFGDPTLEILLLFAAGFVIFLLFLATVAAAAFFILRKK